MLLYAGRDRTRSKLIPLPVIFNTVIYTVLMYFNRLRFRGRDGPDVLTVAPPNVSSMFQCFVNISLALVFSTLF